MTTAENADLAHLALEGAYYSPRPRWQLIIRPEANLRGADFRGADLRGACLCRADLAGADLTGANLSGAYLTGADLSWADLTRANLTYTHLQQTKLRGAILLGTCLEPGAAVIPATDADILSSGLQIDGCKVWGWRTRNYLETGGQAYVPGARVRAPWLSVCALSPCHPGIGLAGRVAVESRHPGEDLVRVSCLRHALVHVSYQRHHVAPSFRRRYVSEFAGYMWRTSEVVVYAPDYLAPFER